MRAVAAPMPLDPPVTTATFPCNSSMKRSLSPLRHCEEGPKADEAIQTTPQHRMEIQSGLLRRFAPRNDGCLPREVLPQPLPALEIILLQLGRLHRVAR